MKFSVLVTFFCDGTGRTHGRTDTWMDGIGTDRLFSENIILDSFVRGNVTSRNSKFDSEYSQAFEIN